MAQSKGNPEINKKVATSALVTLLVSVVGFYLGNRYWEAVASLGVTKAEIALALDRAAQLVTPENKGKLYRLAMLDEHAIVRQPVQQRHRKLLRLVNRHLVPKRVIHPVDLLILLPIAKDVLLHLLQVAVMRPRPVGPHLSRYLARRYLHVGLLSNRVCHAPPLSIA